ncbi:hypothetical protein CARUB_v10021254mg [Capsella rubella]|uniref:Uncharacterized protein n=1 Tax=Capsella rubella TaxID=81985 RepID=R0ICV2_9BRAS|nr:hypothetical protein CARUB_v10021254mg [Capsella rubella]
MHAPKHCSLFFNFVEVHIPCPVMVLHHIQVIIMCNIFVNVTVLHPLSAVVLHPVANVCNFMLLLPSINQI